VSGLSSALILACAVCFGDPNDPMTKGAEAAVAVLGAFIVVLLGGVAFFIGFWARRARQLREDRAAQALSDLSAAPKAVAE